MNSYSANMFTSFLYNWYFSLVLDKVVVLVVDVFVAVVIVVVLLLLYSSVFLLLLLLMMMMMMLFVFFMEAEVVETCSTNKTVVTMIISNTPTF